MNNKNDLINLVKKIMEADFVTEVEYELHVDYFKRIILDPEVMDLFKHTPELTPEEIVEKALAYKPLITPPPSLPKNKK
jgi:hypothetical protein